MFKVLFILSLTEVCCSLVFANSMNEGTANPMQGFAAAQIQSFGSEEHTFQPDGDVGNDTYITSLIPVANFGDIQELNVQKFLYGNIYHFWSLIQFTELDDPQYENATVISAELQLYKYNPETGGLTLGILTEDWSESTASWDNRPAYTGYQMLNCQASNEWFTISVTGHVQNWLNGTQDNYGFLLYDYDTPVQKMYQFYSSDFDSLPELRPKLVLNYIPYSSLERCSWAQIKSLL